MAPKKRGGAKKGPVKQIASSDAKLSPVSSAANDSLSQEFSSPTANAQISQHVNTKVGLMCAAASTVFYFNSVVSGGFTFDDNLAVLKNPDVLDRDGDGIMSPFVDVYYHDFWGTPVDSPYTHKSYRPLVVLSFRWDATISREPWIFHLTNTLLYALTTWLVVDAILLKALPKGHTTAEDKYFLLLSSGLWFAAHPVHTEAVAGIVGRAEIMAAILCLLGAKLYKKTVFGASFCFGAACLCKETAVVMPMVLLGGELLPLIVAKERPRYGGGVIRLMLRSVCMASVSIGYIFFRSFLFAGKGGSVKGRPEDNFVPFLAKVDRLRTSLFIMAKYIQLLVWPDKLTCDYGLGVIDPITSWLSREMAFVAIVGSIVAAVAFKALLTAHRTGDATLLLALGWTLAPLIPASHILDIGTVLAERLLFLPSIGMSMLICILLGQQTRKKASRKYSIAAMSVVIFIFASKTMTRVPDWASMASLCSADVKTYPDGLKLNTMMASVLLDESSPEDALLHVERALATASRYKKQNAFIDSQEMDNTLQANIYGDKGSVLLRIAQRASNNQTIIGEAAESFREMKRRDIGKAVPHFAYCDFGFALVFLGKKEEAYDAFQTCMKRIRLTGSAIEYKHVRNYATLMRELSGVATGDANLAKARGREALDAFRRVVSHRDVTPEDAGKWGRQIHKLEQLMAKRLDAQE